MSLRFWPMLLTSPRGLFSVGFLAIVIVACVGAPLFAPFDPVHNVLRDRYQLPGIHHLLGADALGRDILSRLLYGGRSTLGGVGLAMLVASCLGIPLGITAGYFGGRLDVFISRCVDLAMSIPAIIIILMVLAVFGHGQMPAMIMLGVLFAPDISRVARATAISSRNELYVAAARVSGLGHLQIMRRHIWPRLTGPVTIRLSLLAANALIVQTGLSYLGLGVTPPYPSWGAMVAEASGQLQSHAWLIWPAGGTVTLAAFAFVMLGDAVRDAMQASRSSVAPVLSAPARRSDRSPQMIVAGAAPAEATDAILVVSGLTVEMPLAGEPTRIVEDVSFSVRPRETLALVGESGCGKSVTALSIIQMPPGLGRITAGSVVFEGQDLTRAGRGELMRVRGKRIGYISQEPMVALDPSFTIGSQLIEAIRWHQGTDRTAARARMLELLDLVRIRDPRKVARAYPHQISGGMAQRIVIARALAGKPSLLIADEPTTALDSTVQAEILDLLRSLQQQLDMAIILVTHDWGVVADIADRAVVMYAGQTVEHATVRRIFEQPLHPYSIGLLSANAQLARDGERIHAIEGSVPPPGRWPAGCRFGDRCFLASAPCHAAPVALAEPVPGQLARCIRTDRILVELDAQ